MTKQTFTHRTSTGQVETRTSAKPYEYVIVGKLVWDSYTGKPIELADAREMVVSWRTALPTSFGGREFSVFANCHAEKINGGQA